MAETSTILIDVRFVPDRDVDASERQLSDTAASALQAGALGWFGYRSTTIAGSNRDYPSRAGSTALLSYARWPTQAALDAFLASPSWRAAAAVGDAGPWAARAFHLAFAQPAERWATIDLAGDEGRIAHTGLFELRPQASVEDFVRIAQRSATTAVTDTPGLLVAAFHESADKQRVVNFGLWRSADVFDAFAKAPPFDDGYWEPYARNEGFAYERTLSIRPS